MSKFRFLSFILLSLISESWGQGGPPNIRFIRSNGETYSIPGTEIPNMRTETALIEFLTPPGGVTITACVVGIWRFFPRMDYLVLSPTNMGYQLGEHDGEICYDVGNGIALRSLLSYRSIGHDNLDRDAIHIFTETYGGGRRKTLPPYTAPDGEEVEANIPTVFGDVKSFAITGPQPATEDTVGDRTPVIKVMSDPLGNPANGAVCLILNGAVSDTEIGRMHFQVVMNYVDDADGATKPLTMGSFRHFTFNNKGVAPNDCPIESTIGKRGALALGAPRRFERVKNL